MSKPQAAKAATTSKRSIHLDPLSDGALDAIATARKVTLSDLVNDLIKNELYRLQGTEREAVRAILKHQGIDIPRKNSSSPVSGQGGSDAEPIDGVILRNERLGEIVGTAHAPIDDALESVATEITSKSSPRAPRFGSSN